MIFRPIKFKKTTNKSCASNKKIPKMTKQNSSAKRFQLIKRIFAQTQNASIINRKQITGSKTTKTALK